MIPAEVPAGMPAPFACQVCGKALGQRRVRQGLRIHPGCKKSLTSAELDRALLLAQATLERMPEATEDPELRRLFAQATVEAQRLIEDLKRLRSFVGSPRPDDLP